MVAVHLCQNMIQVELLTKLYGDFTAINERSFSLQPGEVMVWPFQRAGFCAEPTA